jgi:protoporphyrinogen oxidase
LHDKFPDVTSEIRNLLGDDLLKIDAPSQIYESKKFIDFPLSPLNLLTKLGPVACATAGIAFMKSRLQKTQGDENFEEFALHKYGRPLAERFLLSYSEKLWGARCRDLSAEVSGSRMKGLNLKTFLIEAIRGRKAKVEHLDGSFYYPKMGYGMICEGIAKSCGLENIRKNARVTGIFHDHHRITGIEINNNETSEVEAMVSTLPLNLFVSMMKPSAPQEIVDVARSLRFRNVILTAFFINRPRITRNASIYFPEDQYPFTRIYEPKNRSEYMSPVEKTSLVAEIPCSTNDDLWKSDEQKLIQLSLKPVREVFGIKDSEILNTRVVKLYNAYPILEVGFEQKVQKLNAFLEQFSNLKITGRSGMFAYTHLHDMMKFGKEVVAEIIATPSFSSADLNLAIGN